MRRTRAFTLLELMVVLAVAGALALVALSSWPAYMQRTRRAAAGAALVATLAQLELRHTRTGKYDQKDPGPVPSVDGYVIHAEECMTLGLAPSADKCIQVAAYPNPPDPVCSTLILRSSGERIPANPVCWP